MDHLNKGAFPDVLLTWFARIWFGLLILANIVLVFFTSADFQADLLRPFHRTDPSPFLLMRPILIAWLGANFVIALPAIGARALRDHLRKRRGRGNVA